MSTQGSMGDRNKNTGAGEVPYLFLALLKANKVTSSWAHTDFFVMWGTPSFSLQKAVIPN